MSYDLGRYGVWIWDTEVTPELAATFEKLGYGTIWVASSPDGDLAVVEETLAATTTITVATSVVNIWKDGADLVAGSCNRIEQRYPGRFLLGIGVGHRETFSAYAKPYEAISAYLDVLDAAGVPAERRVLAALGPKMLRLSAERGVGAHPYLVTPEYTRRARGILGAGALLATEQRVVLTTDPDRARAIGRPTIEKPYLRLVNYLNNLRTLGFDDSDFTDGGSDRLIDALVTSGDASGVGAGLRRHLDAGADHVAIQLLTTVGDDPAEQYAALAGALFDK